MATLDNDNSVSKQRRPIRSDKYTKSSSSLSSASASSTNSSASVVGVTKKICAVCKDIATGMHFGALTCEGCKGFFRRSIKKNGNFICAFEKNCGISKLNRKNCQACRYKACMDAGMKSNLVLSDEEVNKKRELIKRNREKRHEQQSKLNEDEQNRLKNLTEIGSDSSQEPIRLTMADKHLIETLLAGHQKSYDFDYTEFESFRGRNQIVSPKVDEPSSNKLSFAWLVASLDQDPNSQSNKVLSSTSHADLSTIFMSSLHNQADNLDNMTGDEASQHSKKKENQEVFNSLHGVSADDKVQVGNISESYPDHNADPLQTASTSKKLPPNEITETNQSKVQNHMTHDDKDSTAGVSFTYLHGLLRSQGFSLSMVEDNKSKQLLQHFCDIMTWGIRKVIDFCKGIPEFLNLSLVDQIVLLRGSCLEMLVLRSYFAFSSKDNKYMSDKFQYQPSDFLQAGASQEFVEKYNSLHLRMRKMKLQVEEVCLLLALVLFSPDRSGIENRAEVEEIQGNVARALKAFEYTSKKVAHARNMYCELLLILPVLRTINMLFSENIENLQQENESDFNPLILEVNSKTSADEEEDDD